MQTFAFAFKWFAFAKRYTFALECDCMHLLLNVVEGFTIGVYLHPLLVKHIYPSVNSKQIIKCIQSNRRLVREWEKWDWSVKTFGVTDIAYVVKACLQSSPLFTAAHHVLLARTDRDDTDTFCRAVAPPGVAGVAYRLNVTVRQLEGGVEGAGGRWEEIGVIYNVRDLDHFDFFVIRWARPRQRSDPFRSLWFVAHTGMIYWR